MGHGLMLPSITLELSGGVNHQGQGPVGRSLPSMLHHCYITLFIRIIDPLLKLSPDIWSCKIGSIVILVLKNLLRGSLFLQMSIYSFGTAG